MSGTNQNNVSPTTPTAPNQTNSNVYADWKEAFLNEFTTERARSSVTPVKQEADSTTFFDFSGYAEGISKCNPTTARNSARALAHDMIERLANDDGTIPVFRAKTFLDDTNFSSLAKVVAGNKSSHEIIGSARKLMSKPLTKVNDTSNNAVDGDYKEDAPPARQVPSGSGTLQQSTQSNTPHATKLFASTSSLQQPMHGKEPLMPICRHCRKGRHNMYHCRSLDPLRYPERYQTLGYQGNSAMTINGIPAYYSRPYTFIHGQVDAAERKNNAKGKTTNTISSGEAKRQASKEPP